MIRPPRQSAGFSLVELLIVVAIVGILAALAIPDANPPAHERLEGAARIIRADLAYGRGLAVMNNTYYRFTFDLAANSYSFEHSGTNPAFETLPANPFRSSGDSADRHTVVLAELPQLGGRVTLAAVQTEGGIASAATQLEFGPLGETTRSDATVIWLAAGAPTAQRYMALRVNPVTGLASIGPLEASPPAAASSAF